MTSPELSDLDYLREIERLANRVTVEASNEGWLSFQADPDEATPLQRSVNALARALRHYHFEGDGCLDEDRPLVRLVGASVLRPGAMPAGVEEAYEEVCARIGVDPRPEGWALWNTWSDGDLKVTMVVSAVETTQGLFVMDARESTRPGVTAALPDRTRPPGMDRADDVLTSWRQPDWF
ncbi:hypothetical protein PV417_25120 [Streptomyces sp. ME19-03-3]|nr:hypothetical protein [Streptomyces sp. ME19-03-3]